MPPTPSHRDAGAVTTIVAAMLAVVLVPLTLLLFHVGRLHITKQEMSNATDALALAAASSLRERGLDDHGRLQLSQDTIRAVIRAHTLRGVKGSVRLVSRSTDPYAVVRAQLYTQTKSGAQTSSRRIEATAHASVRQQQLATRWPVVVVVADVSPSMNDRVGSTTNFQLLRSMLLQYAGSPLPVRNGLVLFNGSIAARVNPPQPQMSNIAAFRKAITDQTIGYGSDVREALQTATTMLGPFDQPDTQRNVIVISDAMANRGSWKFWSIGDVVAETARGLRYSGHSGVALHSIEMLQNSTLTDVGTWLMGCSGLLLRIAGGPKGAGNDPHFYQGVTSYGHIRTFLDQMSEWVCSYGPIELSAPPTRLLGVFFQTSTGHEHRLAPVQSSVDEGYQVASTNSGDYVSLTRKTCYALGRDSGARLVLRAGPARLTDAPGVPVLAPLSGRCGIQQRHATPAP